MLVAGNIDLSCIDPLTGFKAVLLCCLVIGIYQLYFFALPKPISGIPYKEESAKSLLGDIPTVLSGLSRKPELRVAFNERARSLKARLVQIFPGPLTLPIVILDDAREALDIMLYRSRDFDRTPLVRALLSWVIPNHHSVFPTGPRWRAHRKLIQTMMTDQFLDQVATPAIYEMNLDLIRLWTRKEKIAEGSAFAAFRDIEICTLDAMLALTFGDCAPRGTKAQLENFRRFDASENHASGNGIQRTEDVITFPQAAVDKLTDSFSKIQHSVDWTTSTLFPGVLGWFMRRNPILVPKFRTIHQFIHLSVNRSIQRLNEKVVTPHVGMDHIVFREHAISIEEDRPPQYHSSAVRDEVFGFLLFGNHTTRTTLSWAVKLLADNQTAQAKLRDALREAFLSAANEGRIPTATEVQGASVPYLDATIEEILRLQPIIEVGRTAVRDVHIFDQVIPKGTIVLTLNQGAGVMYPLYNTSIHHNSSQPSQRWESYGTIDEATAQHFVPERWLTIADDSAEAQRFNPTACYSLAFGAGPRGCWGRRLAYLQIRFFVAMAVWSFEFQPCPERLSGYQSVEGIVRVPDNCYVKLKTIE